jgi:hypothetical protein
VEVVISALPNVWLVLLQEQQTALIAKTDTTSRIPPAQNAPQNAPQLVHSKMETSFVMNVLLVTLE